MARNVTSYNFYDKENSRMGVGVTDRGTAYIDIAPIYDVYRGVENPEKGAKVYDNEGSLFFPVTLEMAMEIKLILETFLETEEEMEPISILNEAETRSLTISREGENLDWIFELEVVEGNDTLSIIHTFTNVSELFGIHMSAKVLIDFLDKVSISVYRLVYQALPDSGGGRYNNDSGGRSSGSMRRSSGSRLSRGGGSQSGGSPRARLGGSRRSGRPSIRPEDLED